MKEYKIKVTKRHIQAGIRGLCEACPISLAFQEVFKNEVRVFETYSNFTECPTIKKSLKHSREVEKWINTFDDFLEVNEITLKVDLEEDFISLVQ